MLTLWMGYALLLSLSIAAIAFATERVLAIWRLPQRFVWIAAIVAAGVVPAGLTLRRMAVARPIPTRAFGGALVRGGIARGTIAPTLPLLRRVRLLARRADPYVRAGWLAASTIVVALFIRAMLGLARRRSHWREDDVRGRRVLISPDAGPAVVGLLHPQIVVPEWALQLGATELGLLLRHEREHVDARDPNALLLATLALIVFPWNAVLWWMVHRLRLSVEIDCDARVLRSIDAPREYGLLLLAVGERRNLALPLSASLAERRSLLERRIHAMTTLRPRYPLLASLPFAAIGLAATVAAAQTSPPAPVAGIIRVTGAAGGFGTVGSSEEPKMSLEQARAIIAAHHPSVIEGNPDSTSVAIVLDATDHYVKSTVRVPIAAPAMASGGGSGGEYTVAGRLVATPAAVGAGGSSGSGASGSGGAVVGSAHITMVGGSGGFGGSAPGDMTIQGLGTIPTEEIQSMQSVHFAAGELGPNAVRVLVIKLK